MSEIELCKGCQKPTEVFYATKETKQKAYGWRCEECYFKYLKKQRKQQQGIKKMSSNPNAF
jgi:DNA-directed RNA polymerase subunit RPC12/RpoP